MCAAGTPLPAHIDVLPNDSPRHVHVVTVKTGAMVLIFSNDPEPSGGRAMPFPPARYAGRGNSVFASEEICLLTAKVDHDPWLSSMPFRDVCRDEIVHRAARA